MEIHDVFQLRLCVISRQQHYAKLAIVVWQSGWLPQQQLMLAEHNKLNKSSVTVIITFTFTSCL